MIFQNIMACQKLPNIVAPTNIDWEAATSGNYPNLGATKVTTFSPSAANVNAYNHHPHIIEFRGAIHIFYSTANTDEEEPGQYVRYQKSTDNGVTWSLPSTLLESQDDILKGWAVFGRVCIPAAYAIVGVDLYALVDINDKGASNSSRIGIGILAIKINSDGTFGTPVWIENVDGTFIAPSPISGYPSYVFDLSLRTQVREYLLDPKNLPTWYYSVLSSDALYSRSSYGGYELSEPSMAELPKGGYIKLWRLLNPVANTKIAQFSANGYLFNSPFDTNIPDQPSRTKILRLNNNNVCIVGNNDSTERTPLFFSHSIDGLVYKSQNTYNIDTEITGAVYSGVFKTTGAQYPDAWQLEDGRLAVVYSVNKEDIRVSLFNIPTII